MKRSCSARKKVYVGMNHDVQKTKYLLRLSDRSQEQKQRFFYLKKSVYKNMRCEQKKLLLTF